MLRVDEVRERESLAPMVDVLLANEKDMKFLTFVNNLPSIVAIGGKPVIAQKHEWNDLEAKPVKVTCEPSGADSDWDTTDETNDLPVNSDDVKNLAAGDVLLLDDNGADSEQVIVKKVDTSANTIDVYSRGHGDTTAAKQGTSDFEAKVVGHASIEGGDPQTAYFQGFTTRYNYCQIFEDTASQSGTLRRSLVPGGDSMDQAVAIQLKEQMRQLNRAIIHGTRNLDSSNHIATMGGIREFLSETKDFDSDLKKSLLEAAVVQAIEAGCNPDAIHASPGDISKISQLYESQTQPQIGNSQAGFSAVQLSIAGEWLTLMPDRDIPSGEAYILDYDRIGYGPLEGGERGDWASYILWDKQNLNQDGRQVGGEFTLQVNNPAGAGLRIYGIN